MLNESFHRVTVDRLIAEAGISKGSFFYHFASKDELPAALLSRFIERQGNQIQAIFAEAEHLEEQSALARLLWVIDQTTEVFCQVYDGRPGCVMAAFSYQLMMDFPGLREINQHALAGWKAGFTPWFAAALAPTYQSEADELAMLFLSILQGGNVIARIENSPQAIQLAAKHFKLHVQLCSNPPQ